MAQTHYLESDEEIISAVGRLRKTGEAENTFVFPKRALILQSIVNLKLLEREARKLGKHITIVTQDAEGRLLAQKAGFVTRDYNEDHEKPSVPQENFTVAPVETAPQPPSLPQSIRPPRATAIGSTDFYSGAAPEPAAPLVSAPKVSVPALASQPRSVRVRNASPAPLTSLNSLRTEEEKKPLSSLASVAPTYPPLPQNFVPQAKRLPVSSSQSTPPQQTSPQKEKLHRFMAGAKEHFLPNAAPTPTQSMYPQARPSMRNEYVESMPAPPKHSTRVATVVFVLLGALSALAVIGALLFVFWPKANITVIPQESAKEVTYQFIGTKDGQGIDDALKAIPARVVETEKTIKLSSDATGTGTGEVGKAKGTVILTNNYSIDPQPLVATTRLATPDGKVFRLTQGVTIPGITKGASGNQPGVIEASVIADQPGESYNIGPSMFNIPGFQGSPKYEKFTGKSTTAFTGGGASQSNGQKTVSQADLDQAKQKATDEAKSSFINDVQAGLQNGERLFEESMDVAIVGTPTAPSVGTTANSFDYQIKLKLRSFVIDENKLKESIDNQAKETDRASSASLKTASYTLVYGVPLANFDSGRVDFSVQAKMLLQAPLDLDKLKSELLGQNEAGIQSVLERHPEIKSLQVEFEPKMFIATIPKNPKQVMVKVVEDTKP